MLIDSLIEKTIIRRALLVERFFYQEEHSVSELAGSFGVDRNTLLADVEALASTLSPSVASHVRGRGTVLLSFRRGTQLASLSQAVYRQSMLLRLCEAYLGEERVSIERFARRSGVSVSTAYALNRKAKVGFRNMGAEVVAGSLVCDEVLMRLIGILIRTMTGSTAPSLSEHALGIDAFILHAEGHLGRVYRGLDRSFLRTGIALCFERAHRPLDEWFLSGVENIPHRGFFLENLRIAGKLLPLQDALFAAFLFQCIDAGSRELGRQEEERLWVDGSREFSSLKRAFEEAYGEELVGDELFMGSLRRLFLFARFGLSNTVMIQHRPIPGEAAPIQRKNIEIVNEWAKGEPFPYRQNDDLVGHFTLQTLPLFEKGGGSGRPACIVVTLSHLNMLSFAKTIERLYGRTIEVLPERCESLSEAYDRRGRCSGRKCVILLDREYPSCADAPLDADAIAVASILDADDAIPCAMARLLG